MYYLPIKKADMFKYIQPLFFLDYSKISNSDAHIRECQPGTWNQSLTYFLGIHLKIFANPKFENTTITYYFPGIFMCKKMRREIKLYVLVGAVPSLISLPTQLKCPVMVDNLCIAFVTHICASENYTLFIT